MKKRTIMITLVVLGLLLLVGVGFAAWTITNPNAVHQGAQEANIAAYAVENESYSLSFQFVTDATGETTAASPSIIFGKTTGTANWLSATDVENENLKVFVKISVDNAQNLPESLPIAFAFTKDKTDNSAYSACTTANLISGPTYKIGSSTVTAVAKTAFSAATGAASVVVEIDFAWGTAFNSQNPFTYYNGQTYDSELAAAATTNLGLIYALNGGQYTFTFGSAA